MCKLGDIIIVQSFKDRDGQIVPPHSFVVISDESDEIHGLPYDMVCNILSSFKSEEHKRRRLSFKENYEINSADMITNPHNDKSGFIKADQLYFFAKDKIVFSVIGYMESSALDELIKYVESSDFKFTEITTNL